MKLSSSASDPNRGPWLESSHAATTFGFSEPHYISFVVFMDVRAADVQATN